MKIFGENFNSFESSQELRQGDGLCACFSILRWKLSYEEPGVTTLMNDIQQIQYFFLLHGWTCCKIATMQKQWNLPSPQYIRCFLKKSDIPLPKCKTQLEILFIVIFTHVSDFIYMPSIFIHGFCHLTFYSHLQKCSGFSFLCFSPSYFCV